VWRPRAAGGSEVVLFLHGIAITGGASMIEMIIGGARRPGWVGVSALMYLAC